MIHGELEEKYDMNTCDDLDGYVNNSVLSVIHKRGCSVNHTNIVELLVSGYFFCEFHLICIIFIIY